MSLGPYLRCPLRYRLGEVGRLLWSWRSLSQSMSAAFVSECVRGWNQLTLETLEWNIHICNGLCECVRT